MSLKLLPLWHPPAPPAAGVGHNGGPPLEPARRGGPTPEVREAIMDALASGVPLRAICRVQGMPPEATVRRWRAADEEFDREFRFCQEEGWHHLANEVVAEGERLIEERGWRHARQVFAIRRHQLARQAPSFFAHPGCEER